MNIIAHTKDGMKYKKQLPVQQIDVWMNGKVNHSINQQSLSALLEQAKHSNQMQIYENGPLDGIIDAFDGTPLFTNGQVSVVKLQADGFVVWQKK
ncbi:MAG: hypothetical protein KGY50_05255 [Candidatus Thermoplasmatota archaeon]|nr:hypothetical protein [Candidatus Thermoplasmatota archaeon]